MVTSVGNFGRLIPNIKVAFGSNFGAQQAETKALTDLAPVRDNDFNTAAALAAIHDMVREVNTVVASDGIGIDDRTAVPDAIARVDSGLGIFGAEDDEMLDADIEALIEERQQGRGKRDFARSDESRD